jgi:hypothetical protein
VKLKKGDYIYIAVRSEAMVSIIGSINRPHKRLWDQNLGILELVSSGLGLKEQYWQYGVIIRGGMENPRFYRVDIDGILQGRCAVCVVGRRLTMTSYSEGRITVGGEIDSIDFCGGLCGGEEEK